MKGTVYRIRRTKLKDDTYLDGREVGHVSYLERFSGTGRQYRFRSRPVICFHCLDIHAAIDFPSLSEARKKLRCAAVLEYLTGMYDDEIDYAKSIDRIEVVEVTFRAPAARVVGLEIPDGHYAVDVERVLWPTPPVLDRLAAI